MGIGIAIAAIGLIAAASSAGSSGSRLTADQQEARDIFKELVEINTTHSTGSTTEAAIAVAKRLKVAGFADPDIQIGGPSPKKENLVARYRGSTRRKPLLLLAHLDVVEARREDWSVDPFQLLERDGYLYGRGTGDDKAQAAIWVATLIRLKRERFQPDRDLILALTADEESGTENGVKWLLQNHRDWIDAGLCLNEGGEAQMRGGKYLLSGLQTSEKNHVRFGLEAKNKGGHSSRPIQDNAIVHLSAGLVRLGAFDFPVALDQVTRGFFEATARLESGQLAADLRGAAQQPPDLAAIQRLSQSPLYNALMRTTCVPTRVDAGHADNALPQTARATISCRILPSDSVENVKRTLREVLHDDQISISQVNQAVINPPSPITRELLDPLERVTQEMWPGIPVIPMMQTGATDGRHLRAAGIPTYGMSGLFHDVDDVRAHGRDERVGVKQFFESEEFLYRLVKAMSSSRNRETP
jgi:acetylornithine deacetylase/succinyl-diaminopimelate desuccinylase-like protein